MLCAFGAHGCLAGAGLCFQMGQSSRIFIYERHRRAHMVHKCPDLQRSMCAFFGVLCGVLLVEASAWARRASQSRIMHADPRGSSDLVLDVRLAGTGPSAHRVDGDKDGGPIGQRALLPM